VLRTFVRSSVEKILKEAPWTFNKVNPLKEACREFLREVDKSADKEREHHGVGSEPGTSETASVGERERESDERKRKSQVTRKLTLLATKALVAACDSGRPALAEPALGAAHKLVAMGFLQGTTDGSRARTVTDRRRKRPPRQIRTRTRRRRRRRRTPKRTPTSLYSTTRASLRCALSARALLSSPTGPPEVETRKETPHTSPLWGRFWRARSVRLFC
jgi:hypothetical protein